MLWIILHCLNCDIEPARASGWSAEAAMASDQGVPGTWRGDDPRREFSTRAACMTTLLREHPEHDFTAPDAYGQIDTVEHRGDHVYEFEAIPYRQNTEVLRGCFHRAPPVG